MLLLEKGANFTQYLRACVIALAVVTSTLAASIRKTDARADECTDGYENHPLILISMDGFRADYINRGLTPRIQSLKDRGVSAPYMKATYPTSTFPNHYTIVTGLYPESHGIIANEFYDSDFNASFSLGSDESLNARWWGGNPIWNTATDQGKLSGTMYWPGSEAPIEGKYPTYWFPYNQSSPFTARVDQVLDWLALPEPSRPQIITLYFHEPDSAGHEFGPDSTEVDNELSVMDDIFGYLLDGLESMNLTSCVNIFLVSDHGMATGGLSRVVKMEDFIYDLPSQGFFYSGGFPRIDVYQNGEEMMANVSCKNASLRQFQPTELPKRFHYVNNLRIDDIIFDLDAGYYALYEQFFSSQGHHGYDNYFSDMEALFIAAGPDLKEGYTTEPFQNIELYNLMCDLLNISASLNNGTFGSLYDLMINPPSYPALIEEIPPPVAEFPETAELNDRLEISGCDGDLSTAEPWLFSLNISTAEQLAIENYSLPWGLPYIGDLPADLRLLYQQDHVTGYSTFLKMPLWISFTLESGFAGSQEAAWSSDVRLDESNTATCESYDSVVFPNATMAPLFRPTFSSDANLDRVPYIVSNAVPMTSEFETKWSQLQDELIPNWVDLADSPINVIVGPVFDQDGDSFADNFTLFDSSPEVPSDFFTILTKCTVTVDSLNDCAASDLDNLGFIYHIGQIASNCLSTERYAQEFTAKVTDIEKATGLTFYTAISYEESLKLRIRIQSDIWPTA